MKNQLLIVLLCASIGVAAREPALKNHELSTTFGMGSTGVSKSAMTAHLDFLNYMYSPADNLSPLMRFSYRFDYLSDFSANITLIGSQYFLLPDGYDISTHYFVVPWFGIGIGTFFDRDYSASFEGYQRDMLPDYFLVDQNSKMLTLSDIGFYISPTVKLLNSDAVKIQLTCDIGLSSFLKQEATFFHKKQNGNERIRYDYATTNNFRPFVQPKLDLRVRVIKGRRTSWGLLLNAGYFYSCRSINYEQTVTKWTADNTITELIKPDKHHYSRYEASLGITVGW